MKSWRMKDKLRNLMILMKPIETKSIKESLSKKSESNVKKSLKGNLFVFILNQSQVETLIFLK